MPNESSAHLRLKVLAFDWARSVGMGILASEVSLPQTRFRADLVGLEVKNGGKTAIFECKQARSDLLKDAHDTQSTWAEVEVLASRLRNLESLIGEHRPDLRKGESLFPEFDAVDLSSTRHAGYRKLLMALAVRQARLIRGTKFARLFHWRTADLFYLVSEPDIFAPAEIPAGWGLLVRRGDRLQLERRPVQLDSGEDARRRLLLAVAAAGTRATARSLGMVFKPSDEK
ncbi:MAG: hypothetical protein RIR76_373 [Verrucomicrobiota bacterium]|jgi:hypothetical protein